MLYVCTSQDAQMDSISECTRSDYANFDSTAALANWFSCTSNSLSAFSVNPEKCVPYYSFLCAASLPPLHLTLTNRLLVVGCGGAETPSICLAPSILLLPWPRSPTRWLNCYYKHTTSWHMHPFFVAASESPPFPPLSPHCHFPLKQIYPCLLWWFPECWNPFPTAS